MLAAMAGRVLKFCVIGLLLLSGLWCYENWKGARAWETLKREYAAKGKALSLPEPFDQQGKEIPDDDNFFCHTVAEAIQNRASSESHVLVVPRVIKPRAGAKV